MFSAQRTILKYINYSKRSVRMCGGSAMEDQLWSMFRETGEPMGYLLYRAEKKQKDSKAEQKKPESMPPDRPPTASA